MNQTKQLLSVVEDIRRLADSLQSLCELITEGKLEQTFVEAKKAQEGKQAEVRELIKTYGVSKLSEVDAKNYVELMKKAEEL